MKDNKRDELQQPPDPRNLASSNKSHFYSFWPPVLPVFYSSMCVTTILSESGRPTSCVIIGLLAVCSPQAEVKDEREEEEERAFTSCWNGIV
jgi:hypothetical protein